MAGGNFMNRVMSYVVNELLVNSLANRLSLKQNIRAFQRFAVRTSKRIEDLSKIAAEKKIDITEQMKDFSRNVQESLKNK